MKHIHKITSKDGTLFFPTKDIFAQQLRDLGDGTYILTLAKKRKKRSLPQNAYYWCVLKSIADFCGYDDTKELHEIFKAKFLRYADPTFGFRIQSTSKMNTLEFTAYIDKVIRAGKEIGAVILSPQEYIIMMNEELFYV
jgi:hypothetical protein